MVDRCWLVVVVYYSLMVVGWLLGCGWSLVVVVGLLFVDY